MVKEGQCRFCLETDSVANLIAPCVCKGSFKYVHNKCLLQWYQAQPEKGLSCGVCKKEYKRKQYIQTEELYVEDNFYALHLYNPIYMILAYHILYILSRVEYYYIFQGLIHTLYFYYLREQISKVKNRGLYFQLWLKDSRLVLPIAHVYFWITVPLSQWVGGICANMCLCFYFYEHFDILYEINNKSDKFVFISRRSRKKAVEQDPSST